MSSAWGSVWGSPGPGLGPGIPTAQMHELHQELRPFQGTEKQIKVDNMEIRHEQITQICKSSSSSTNGPHAEPPQQELRCAGPGLIHLPPASQPEPVPVSSIPSSQGSCIPRLNTAQLADEFLLPAHNLQRNRAGDCTTLRCTPGTSSKSLIFSLRVAVSVNTYQRQLPVQSTAAPVLEHEK